MTSKRALNKERNRGGNKGGEREFVAYPVGLRGHEGDGAFGAAGVVAEGPAKVLEDAQAVGRGVGLGGDGAVALGLAGEAHLEPAGGADGVRDVAGPERRR